MDNQELNREINTPELPPHKNWLSRHMIVGYVFLGLVLAGAIWAGYEMKYGGIKNQDDQVCIQVIQKARNKDTGEVKEFPTPCDVPEGWEKIGPEEVDETANWQTYRSNKFGFELKYPADLTATEQLKEDLDLEPENPNNETFDFFSLNLSGIDRQAFNFNLYINHPGIGFEGTELLSKTTVTIGGVKAEKQILEVAEGHEKGEKSMLFAFEKGTNEYLIYVTGFSDQADKILSTFKFLSN